MTRTTVIIVLALAASTAAVTAAAASYGPDSSAPVPCLVPDLKYSTLAQANEALLGTRCKLGAVTKRYPKRRHGPGRRKSCPKGTRLLVTRQSPKAGSQRPIDSKVDLRRTCGKQPPALFPRT